jgi:hypothetical protein
VASRRGPLTLAARQAAKLEPVLGAQTDLLPGFWPPCR